MDQYYLNTELDRSLKLVEGVTLFGGEPITAAYLKPERDGLRLVSDSPKRVLQLMNDSSEPRTAMGNLETPSGKLLGFAFHPIDRSAAQRVANLLEPSFIVEADEEIIELIYLVEGTNEEISAVRTAIDGKCEGEKTSAMFLLPFKGGRLAGPSLDAIDERPVLKFYQPQAILAHLSVFRA